MLERRKSTMRPPAVGPHLVPEQRLDLSIVIPVYGCSGTLRPLHERLSRVLSTLVERYEVIFIDDRGPGEPWAILQELAQSDPHVIACRLSRNFGQQMAITAGLEQSSGDYVVVMDCDLQDPPEAIEKLVETAHRRFDIVFAKRRTPFRPAIRTIGSRLYFRLLSLLSGSTIDDELGAFSLVSRRVVEAFLRFRERDRLYLPILHWLGFETTTIEYDRAVRPVGNSSYSIGKLIALGLSGMFFMTTRLLHWVVYAGLVLAGSSGLLALYFIIHWFLAGPVAGWTSLIVVQLLVGGLIILCVGIAALYIGKIFEASQQRPLYILQDRIDGSEVAAPADPDPAAVKPSS
jgi:glycosyltransferase involved in cell wall biosynthesis